MTWKEHFDGSALIGKQIPLKSIKVGDFINVKGGYDWYAGIITNVKGYQLWGLYIMNKTDKAFNIEDRDYRTLNYESEYQYMNYNKTGTILLKRNCVRPEDRR